MKLPNVEKAFVRQTKIINYLLSESHVTGRSKSKFFRTLGFDSTRIEELINLLLKIAKTNDVVKEETSSYGKKYIIDGTMFTTSGKEVSIRTVWIIELGDDHPRFVTAYPN